MRLYREFVERRMVVSKLRAQITELNQKMMSEKIREERAKFKYIFKSRFCTFSAYSDLCRSGDLEAASLVLDLMHEGTKFFNDEKELDRRVTDVLYGYSDIHYHRHVCGTGVTFVFPSINSIF